MKYQIRKFKNLLDHSRQLAGFTLLELLVVISIIAIMVTMGVTSFSTAQKKGRDAKRKSDIKEVQQALEQYYSICNFNYPVPTGFYSQGIICSSPSIAILPTVPADPRATPPYACTSCSSSVYTLCATLEGESPNTFCVSNQQ